MYIYIYRYTHIYWRRGFVQLVCQFVSCWLVGQLVNQFVDFDIGVAVAVVVVIVAVAVVAAAVVVDFICRIMTTCYVLYIYT